MAERSRIKLPSQKFIGRPINAPNCCGAHDLGRFWRFPLPRPSVVVLTPPPPNSSPTLTWHPLEMPNGNAHPLGLSDSKKGLGQWSFLPRMTHIRNRAQTGVSGKGLAPSWLKTGAEAGGKLLERDGRPLVHRVKWTGRTTLHHGPRMHRAEVEREPRDGESRGLGSSPVLLLLTLWPECSHSSKGGLV